jgi:hypothetical protein
VSGLDDEAEVDGILDAVTAGEIGCSDETRTPPSRRERVDRSLAAGRPRAGRSSRLRESVLDARHAASEMHRAMKEFEDLAAADETPDGYQRRKTAAVRLAEPLSRIELVRRLATALLERYDWRPALVEEG